MLGLQIAITGSFVMLVVCFIDLTKPYGDSIGWPLVLIRRGAITTLVAGLLMAVWAC